MILNEWLTFAKCKQIFEECEQLVCGIKVGVSVPLELSMKDLEIINEIIVDLANAEMIVYRKDILRARTRGMFFKWLKNQGRIK